MLGFFSQTVNIPSPVQNELLKINNLLSYTSVNCGIEVHSPKKHMPSLDSSRKGSIYRSSLLCRPTSTRLSCQRTDTQPCRITLMPPSPAQLSPEHLRPSAHSWSLAPPTQRCTLCPQTVRRWRLNKEAVFWSNEALPFLARHTGAGSQTKKIWKNSTKLSSRIAVWC